MKVPFSMPCFSSRKMLAHHLNFENTRGDEGNRYDMIIGRYIMVKLGLKADFGHQILEWGDTVIPMKDTGNFLGQPDLDKRKIQEVVMQTAGPYSIRKTT